MDDKLKKELMNLKGTLKFNEPMSEHTTIKIGGPADIWFEPADIEDLLKGVGFADAHDIPRMVFGNGSNTLVRDGGIRGMVISLARFDSIEILDNRPVEEGPRSVKVGAGVPIQRLISWSIDSELSGFERLTGIPGTIGGAICMNAGAGQGTIGDLVRSVSMIARGRLTIVEKDSLEFSYRKLKLQKNSIILSAEISLTPCARAEIEERVHKMREKRKETQPLLWPSLGSVFKNPDGKEKEKAWELIDDCGLRGVRVGGARIANEHANWIINEGGATAKDVEVLIKLIKERVRDRSKITLDTEIIVVGEII